MKFNTNFSYRTILTSLRPQKVATLLNMNDEDWIDSSIRIIEYYSQLWGGNYDLIIPTDGGKIDNIFLEILREYDPDYIFKYSKSFLDKKYIDKEKYYNVFSEQIKKLKKDFPEWSDEKIEKWIDDQAKMSDLDDLEISNGLKQEFLDELNPLYERDDFLTGHTVGAKQTPDYPLTSIIEIFKSSNLEKIVNFKINDSNIFQLLGYSITGSAQYIKIINKNSKKENNKDKNLLEISKKAFEEKIIERGNLGDFLDLIYQNKYSSHNDEVEKVMHFTPFEQSMRNLVYLQLLDQRRPRIRDTVVVVIGDEIMDFCLYYNLLKLKKGVIWVPKNLIEKENFLDDYLIKMYMAISEKSRKNNEKLDLVFTSISLAKNEVEDIMKLLKKYDIGVDNANKAISIDLDRLMPYMNFVYEKDNYTNVNVEPFLGNESINLINIPLPRSSNFNLQNINPLEFRWLTDIRIGTKVSGKLDRGYILPRKRLFSNYIFDKSVYTGYARVSKDGLSICSPYFTPFARGDSLTNVVNMNRPRVIILDDFDAFKIMFEDIGYSVDLSDKGKYLLESVNKAGSLEELASIFLDNRQLSLLKEFIVEKKLLTEENHATKKRNYFINGRIYVNYTTIEEVIGKDTEKIIDDYLKKNILYRGFIFKCDKCDNTEWYSISEIDESFKCKRCSTIQLYLKDNWKLEASSKEPTWYYKLDEVFYQGFSNDMHVTVLTLNKLKNTCERSFIYIPEIELFHKEIQKEEKNRKEIDICCLCDGKIILGECKKNSRLENTEKKEKDILKSLADIFLKLKADRCVFSTYSENWRDKTVKLIDNIFQEYKLIFNANDLLT